ncbi:MAG: IS21 family transposase [Petrimonas sp.]|jgi:hypothetical protein|nr:IS21 family transposase [Petrimonas sp.]
MAVTDKQVLLLMKNHEKTGSIETAAAKAGMCRQTASKYLQGAKMPSKAKTQKRLWRTREDPLADIWKEAEEMLEIPELESKALFDYLCEKHPDKLLENHLRTFQRRVREWKATKGPNQEVFFPQDVTPGRRMSVDFTHMNALEITINGEAFAHMLCHSVLSYSGWEWASVCFSESLQALKTGIQDAVFRLGHVPEELWTDNSTSATHNPSKTGDTAKRSFNLRYLSLTEHFGMKPHTINIGKSNENGAVESLNGHIKRRINQHLLLRGSRDFASREEYDHFLCVVLNKANNLRRERLKEELKHMPELKASRLSEWDEEQAVVRKWSTVNLAKNVYSVPSRLIGRTVTGRIYEDRIEIYYNGELQLEAPRLRGRGNTNINYRHVIHSLARKPGAFRDYRYRQEMFPTHNFRRTYDQLEQNCSPRLADMEYLRILKLAADLMQSMVDEVLADLLAKDILPRWSVVEEFMPTVCHDSPLDVTIENVDLSVYDDLLKEVR